MKLQYNSAKRFLAGVAAAVALFLAASGPVQHAAGNRSGAGQAGVIAAIQVTALQAYEGTAQFASELRSLYSVYQLQSSDAFSSPAPETLAASPNDEAQFIRCEIFPAPETPKKKSVI